MTVLGQFPHCDQRILHAPEDGCTYCNERHEWQALRQAWGIAFTGHAPRAGLPRCKKPMRDTFPGYGPGVTCQQPRGHEDDCCPVPAWDAMPCPADAARPAGASSDHRRWAGNKPTSATGDPSWPAETAASRAMYGDKGGRAPWPLRERITRRVRRLWRAAMTAGISFGAAAGKPSYQATLNEIHQPLADGDAFTVTVNGETREFRVIGATPLGEGAWRYDLEPYPEAEPS